MDVIVNEQSVSFRISNELLFASGQATLSPAGLDVIKRLAAILNKNEYQVSVEGHSDTVPIQTRQFASNWELSSSRATACCASWCATACPPAACARWAMPKRDPSRATKRRPAAPPTAASS